MWIPEHLPNMPSYRIALSSAFIIWNLAVAKHDHIYDGIAYIIHAYAVVIKCFTRMKNMSGWKYNKKKNGIWLI